MSRPVAVYTDVVDLDPDPGVQLLRAGGFDVRVLGTDDPDLIAAGAHDADVLLVGYSPVDAALMDRLPGLRLICTQSAGFDVVDVKAAGSRGIWVANVAGAANAEVATHALSMALALVRCLPQLQQGVREGVWDGTRLPLRMPGSLTLGVVGLGRIGQHLAAIAAPLFSRVVAHDPVLGAAAWPAGVESLSLPDLLRASDVVSLHLPLTQETHHLVGAAELALLPRDAVLLNLSRGELVDHDALLTALDAGHLSSAGLDVLPEEPPDPTSPVLHHPRVLVTPHAAYLSPESAKAYVRIQAQNALAWLQTGEPLHPVVRGR